MNRRWTENEIKAWYDALPWLRGCNFLPSNCVNRLDMWQSYKRNEHLETADRELALCNETGFNTVRLWLNFDVYYKEPEEFMNTLESYISLSAKHNQAVMIVLAYEEDLPYGEKFIAKNLGKQKIYFNHFNRDYKLFNECLNENKFRHYSEYPETRELFFEMVERVVKKYREDKRIIAWNVENEPGIGIGKRAIKLLRELFALVRSLDPVQPLAADIWHAVKDDGTLDSEEENVAYELSDFISFHSYSEYEWFLSGLYALKKHYARPIIVTEWLNRCNHNTVRDIYPLLMYDKIGCYCWGFVGGETYTTEPWNDFWEKFEKNPDVNFDFTKWQHDLYRRNYHPYDPREIALIKRCNERADQKRRDKN